MLPVAAPCFFGVPGESFDGWSVFFVRTAALFTSGLFTSENTLWKELLPVAADCEDLGCTGVGNIAAGGDAFEDAGIDSALLIANSLNGSMASSMAIDRNASAYPNPRRLPAAQAAPARDENE